MNMITEDVVVCSSQLNEFEGNFRAVVAIASHVFCFYAN